MSRVHSRSLLTLLLAFAVMFGGATTAPSAWADGKTDTTVCTQELGISKPSSTDAAAKTPVVLVHGLWSKGSTWEGDPSFVTALKGLKDVAIATPFDYESANDDWVTTGDTAQRLAKTIVCLSRLYGGKRVVVVAHSMGGLLTRAALDWAAYGTFAKKVTGHVITIGTPHTGAPIGAFGNDLLTSNCNQAFVWWGREAYENCAIVIGDYAPAAMATGSKQLAALPQIPSGITVKAIAGEVKKLSCAIWGCSVAYSTNGDLVVPVKSATAEYTTTGKGDGKTVFGCEDPIALLQLSHPWCEHNGMLKSPRVQSEVKQSIQDYLAAEKVQHAKPTGRSYAVYGMTLQLDPVWEVRGTDSNGWTVKTDDVVVGYDNPSFQIADFSWLGDQTVESYGDFPGCTDADYSNSAAKLVEKGQRPIGSQQATYYEAELCIDGAKYQETFRVWEVRSANRHVVISTTKSPRFGVNGLDEILAGATWK